MQLSLKVKLTLAFIVQCLVLYVGLGFADFYRVFPVLPFVPIPFVPVTWPGACSVQTATCKGNGTAVLDCSPGGTADFKVTQGVYIANGSTTACNINGVACGTPTAPTAGVFLSSRMANCTDVTVTGNVGGDGQYVTAGLCNFAAYQHGDVIKVDAASNGVALPNAAAGDVGVFTVDTATATTLKFTTTVTGEAAGAPFNFQTMAPVGGGTIALGNCSGDVGVTMNPSQRAFNQCSATSYGCYTRTISVGVCTYSFDATDGGKEVTVWEKLTTPPTGSTAYSVATVHRDSIRNGYSPEGAAATVTTATLNLPNDIHGMPGLWVQPAYQAGAYAYDMRLSINGAADSWATRLWPTVTYVTSGNQTLPAAGGIITVSSTLNWPTSGTFSTSTGQTVTYTGLTTSTFTGATGGTGAIPTGTVLTLLAAPQPHVAYGGGLIIGQDTWTSESMPVAAPTVIGNDDFDPNNTPTVMSISGKTMTLSAPVATGTWTVTHSDMPVWTNIWANSPVGGQTVQMPSSCVSRICQMPFGPLVSNITQDYYMNKIEGGGGTTGNSEIQSYCDGGGYAVAGGVEPNVGAWVTPAHFDMEDTMLSSTNSALGIQYSHDSAVDFGTQALRHVFIRGNWTLGSTTLRGINHTLGIRLRLMEGEFVGNVTQFVDSVISINGGVNQVNFRSRGSYNQDETGHFWHPLVSYWGANSNISFAWANFENPWTFMRPFDGLNTTSLLPLTIENLFLGDVSNFRNNGDTFYIFGAMLDHEGTNSKIGNVFFGQTQAAVDGVQPIQEGLYMGNGLGSNTASIDAVQFTGARNGILTESGAYPYITNVTVADTLSNETAIEIRGSGFLQHARMAPRNGAQNPIAFAVGKQGDEASCNVTSEGTLDYLNQSVTSYSPTVSACSTVLAWRIHNDSGTSVIQGVAPSVGGASCGGGTPSVATGSTNYSGTFTSGTGAPTACVLTFATAVQAGMSSTPRCVVTDQTAAPVTVGAITYAAAPTATATINFAAAASHTFFYQCDNWF